MGEVGGRDDGGYEERKGGETPQQQQQQLYSLQAAALCHDGDLRCLAISVGRSEEGSPRHHVFTGGRDKELKVWTLVERQQQKEEAGHEAGHEQQQQQQQKEGESEYRVAPATLMELEPVCGVTFECWVNAVLTSAEHEAEAVPPTMPPALIVAGLQDGVIVLCGWEDEKRTKLSPKRELYGHQAPLCSLDWMTSGGARAAATCVASPGDPPTDGALPPPPPPTAHAAPPLLCSGAWDDTARVWDLSKAGQEGAVQVLQHGEENNICVLGSLGSGSDGSSSSSSSGSGNNPPRLLTGSTGCAVEGQLKNATLRLWKGSPLTVADGRVDHKLGIRNLCRVCEPSTDGSGGGGGGGGGDGRSSDGGTLYASCSNDGTVRVWSVSAEGDKLQDRAVLGCLDGPYVFDVAATPTGLLVAGDDAGLLRIWQPRGGNLVQAIPQPCTIWCCAASGVLPPAAAAAAVAVGGTSALGDTAGLILTGDSKGALRVYGTDPSKARPPGYGCDLAPQSLHGGMAVDGAASQGGGQGSGSSPLSQATPSALAPDSIGAAAAAAQEAGLATTQTLLDGELFDFVLPVEIDSKSRGFLCLQLGLNVGDDPEVLASDFCARHGLPRGEYEPQIVDFIRANLM